MNTLLVFAKEPVPGRVKTRLAETVGAAAAARLYRAFLADLGAHLGELSGTKITWWIDGAPGRVTEACGPHWNAGWGVRAQPPGTLGERLETAFAAAFRDAPGPVGVVGSDCPLCGPEQISALFSALDRGADAAVLPAEDGGYAGLATRAPLPDLFQEIPWSTARVTAATLDRLGQAGRSVEVLPPVFDVDTAMELGRLGLLLAANPSLAPHSAAAIAEVSGTGEAHP